METRTTARRAIASELAETGYLSAQDIDRIMLDHAMPARPAETSVPALAMGGGVMFAYPPDEPDPSALQPLVEAIEGVCAILDEECEVVIEGLADVPRRRIAFEALKRRVESCDTASNHPRA